MQFVEVFGYAAMVLIPIALAPQVIKSWKSKLTKDISLAWTTVYVLGLLCWLVYGIGMGILPLAISAVVEILLAGSLMFLKLKYG